MSGILYKSFNQIRVTVCLYGQGEEDAVVVVVVCPLLHPGPGVRRFLVQWSLNVSGILYKSFNHIGVTVCLYGQGKGVAVAVVCPLLQPGPGVRRVRGEGGRWPVNAGLADWRMSLTVLVASVARSSTLMAGWVRALTTSQHTQCLPVIIHASEKYLVGFIINNVNIVSTTPAPAQGECQLTGNNKGQASSGD